MAYTSSHRQTKRKFSGNFNQNDGVPGVVYILRNKAFKDTWLKIGCSRNSGSQRAMEMNREASTGLPAHHVCVYEHKTLDCGNAEKAIHQELAAYRKGRQEFFEVDFTLAQKVVQDFCVQIDAAITDENNRLEEVSCNESERLSRHHAECAVQQEHEKRVVQQCIAEEIELRKQSDIAKIQRDEENIRNAQSAKLASLGARRIDEVEFLCRTPQCDETLVGKVSSEVVFRKFRCPRCSSIFEWHRYPKVVPQPSISEEVPLRYVQGVKKRSRMESIMAWIINR